MTIKMFETEEEMLQAFFEDALVGIAVININGECIWLNPLVHEFSGPMAQAGEPIVPREDWPQFKELLSQQKPFYYLVGEQGFTIKPKFLFENQRILLRIIPSSSLEADLATLQKDYIQHRKLANLGRMMLEMAHELNNPLTGISMASQLIGLSLQKIRKQVCSKTLDWDVMWKTLEKIELELNRITQAANRASLLREEVLAYSRPNQLTFSPYQTSKLIKTALKNFESQPLFRQMKIHKEFAQNSPVILCDPIKLEQIAYNLLKNAHEATDGQGEIWIREIVDNDVVFLEFEDNGPGIPSELLDKIFSPFLTTKPRNGTGLGLSISHQIVQKHGGEFSVYNKEGSGACFRICFPIYKETTSAIPA